jgi:hypothetical protein
MKRCTRLDRIAPLAMTASSVRSETIPRQLIGALVLRVTGVALDPVPAHVMWR